MPVSWLRCLAVNTFALQYVHACIDSSGNFYCTTLWYFWFSLFWICMFIFIAVVCIVNRCSKKSRQVDFRMPPIPTASRQGDKPQTAETSIP